MDDFNPRSREGSDPAVFLVVSEHVPISIHAPAKGATFFNFSWSLPSLFQSTLPRRERRVFHGRRLAHAYFNPRSREGSDYKTASVSILFPDFNPRSREGSDGFSNSSLAGHCIISIHAPAKGATEFFPVDVRFRQISIHAPAKGATEFFPVDVRFRQISIHAPAKGATKATSTRNRTNVISIHAPAKGATERRKANAEKIKLFQSTLPRRERLARAAGLQKMNEYFNPRSREGSDMFGASTRQKHINFNPRSREGSDNIILLNTMLLQKFQSTLPRRERPGIMRYIELLLYFNPRSREGSDKERYRQE